MNESFENQCQQILDFRRAHGWRAPCQSRSDPNEHRLGMMKAKLKMRRQKAAGAKPGQSKLTPEQSSHLDWCLSDGAMQSVDCRAPSDHSEPGTHVNNDENPSSPNKRLRVDATSPNGVAVTLCLRGLNIQWPFSQLILLGVKTEEVREYALGHRSICPSGEEVWIVETRGHHVNAKTNAMCDGLPLGPRPLRTQIVGTVRFDDATSYPSTEAFRVASEQHRIALGSKFDWDGKGSRFGWKVDRVRALVGPVPVESTGVTGFGPRSFTVGFTQAAACDDVCMGVGCVAGGIKCTPAPNAADTQATSSASSDQRCPPPKAKGDNSSLLTALASEDRHSTLPYYEIQDRGWCGKHAINNFLGGDFVTQDACRQACTQVVAALSEATGGDTEDSSQHLHPESGWLSIDVMNLLGTGGCNLSHFANVCNLILLTFHSSFKTLPATSGKAWNHTRSTCNDNGCSLHPPPPQGSYAVLHNAGARDPSLPSFYKRKQNTQDYNHQANSVFTLRQTAYRWKTSCIKARWQRFLIGTTSIGLC